MVLFPDSPAPIVERESRRRRTETLLRGNPRNKRPPFEMLFQLFCDILRKHQTHLAMI